MKLYGSTLAPNARRVHLLLEELEVPFEFVLIDVAKGEHLTPEFLAVNPAGRIPVLVDDDFVLGESHAIMQYLAAKYPAKGLDGATLRERSEVAKWLFWNASHVDAHTLLVFMQTILTPTAERNAGLIDIERGELARSMQQLDAHLAKNDFLALGRCTIADLALAPTLLSAAIPIAARGRFPHVDAWSARLRERPAVRRVLGRGRDDEG